MVRLKIAVIAVWAASFGPGVRGGGEGPGRLPRRLELSDDWRLRASCLVSEGGEVVSGPGFVPDGWHRTAVPSTVLRALMANGVYPDFRVGLNAFKIPDASDAFNEKHDLARYSHLPDKRNPWTTPYWFRTEFSLPARAPDGRLWLLFNCINYRADVWLNGKRVADRETMAGMFQRFRYDITAQALPGRNCLAVKIHPVDHPGVPDTQLEVFGRSRSYQKEIMKDVTEVMTIGYDCMPTVPDRNMGIVQEVYVEATGPVVLRDPFVVTDLPLPDVSRAEVGVSVTVVNATEAVRKAVLLGFFVLIFLLLNSMPDMKVGSKMWSPDHLEVLSSTSLVGAAPRAVCQLNRYPGFKPAKRSGALSVNGPPL